LSVAVVGLRRFELIPGLNRLDLLVVGVPVIDHFGFFEVRHFNPS
jgi:hypothetical protein